MLVEAGAGIGAVRAATMVRVVGCGRPGLGGRCGRRGLGGGGGLGGGCAWPPPDPPGALPEPPPLVPEPPVEPLLPPVPVLWVEPVSGTAELAAEEEGDGEPEPSAATGTAPAAGDAPPAVGPPVSPCESKPGT